MTARAVPPPGQPSLPFRDLTLVGRRNLTRALAVSALTHVALLSAILVSQEREPVVRLVRGSVDLVPKPPAAFVPPTPRSIPPIPRTARPEEPAWEIVDRPVIPPPETGVRSERPVEGLEGEGSRSGPVPGTNPGARSLVNGDDPDEVEYVYFDEPPVPIHRPEPQYPPWARENGITGRVLLRALVDTQGNVRRVTVVRGVEGLTGAAQEALRRWTFRPATENGRPVAVWVEVPVEFRIGG